MSDNLPSIVFCDVDGTLVDNKHHPIPATAAVLQRVSRVVPVCLVSARSPKSLRVIQGQLGISGPMACFSGALVLDAEGNELFGATIPVDVACAIKRFVGEELPDIQVGTFAYDEWVVDDRKDPRVQREEFFVQVQSRATSDLTSVFSKTGVHKFLLTGSLEDVTEAACVVGERFPGVSSVRSNDYLCEVMSSAASKSGAVRLLCGHLGADPAGAIAFGDGPNDIGMFRAVGTSYAVANAEDEVKAEATHALPWTNEQCGVTRMLDELFA